MHNFVLAIGILASTGGQSFSSEELFNPIVVGPYCTSLTYCIENAENNLYKERACYENFIIQEEGALPQDDPYLLEVREDLSYSYRKIGNTCLYEGRDRKLPFKSLSTGKLDSKSTSDRDKSRLYKQDTNAIYFYQKAEILLRKNLKIIHTKAAFLKVYRELYQITTSYSYELFIDRDDSVQDIIMLLLNEFVKAEDIYYANLAEEIYSTYQVRSRLENSPLLLSSYVVAHNEFQGIEIFTPHMIGAIKSASLSEEFHVVLREISKASNAALNKLTNTINSMQYTLTKLSYLSELITSNITKYIDYGLHFYPNLNKHYIDLPEISSTFINENPFYELPKKLAGFHEEKGIRHKERNEIRFAIYHFRQAYTLYEYIHSDKVNDVFFHLGAMYCGLDSLEKIDREEGCKYTYKISLLRLDWTSDTYVSSILLRTSCNVEHMVEIFSKQCYIPFSYTLFAFSATPWLFLLGLSIQSFLYCSRYQVLSTLDLVQNFKKLDSIDEKTLFMFAKGYFCIVETIKTQESVKTSIAHIVPSPYPIKKAILSFDKAHVYFHSANHPNQYGLFDITQNPPNFKFKDSILKSAIWLPSNRLLCFHKNRLCIWNPFSGKEDFFFCEDHPTPLSLRYTKKGYVVSASKNTWFLWYMSNSLLYYQAAINNVDDIAYQNDISELPSALRQLILRFSGGYLAMYGKVNCKKIIDIAISEKEKKVLLLTDKEVLTYQIDAFLCENQPYKRSLIEEENKKPELKPTWRVPFSKKIHPRYIKCSADGSQILLHGKKEKKRVVYRLFYKPSWVRWYCRAKRHELIYFKGDKVHLATFLRGSAQQMVLMYGSHSNRMKLTPTTYFFRRGIIAFSISRILVIFLLMSLQWYFHKAIVKPLF